MQIEPVARKNGSSARVLSSSHDGNPERVLHARGARFARRIERHRVPEQHPAGSKRVGQRQVRRDARSVPIRFREDDIQRNRGGPEVAKAADERADDVAAPRPLANRRQASLVDVDDDNPLIGRTRRKRAQKRVVGGVLERRQQRMGDRPRAERRRRWAADRKREPGRGGGLSSDRDFNAAIARLRDVVRRRHEQVRLAVRGHLYQRRIQPRFDEQAPGR